MLSKTFVRVSIFSLLLLLNFATLAQPNKTCFLILKHDDIGKKNYYPGSEITFQIANIWYTATIDSLDSENFFLQEVPIPIKQIQAIKLYRKTFNYKTTGSALIFGGLFLFAIDAINFFIHKGEQPISSSAIVLSSSAILVGLALLPFHSRTFKINESNKLIIICL